MSFARKILRFFGLAVALIAFLIAAQLSAGFVLRSSVVPKTEISSAVR